MLTYRMLIERFYCTTLKLTTPKLYNTLTTDTLTTTSPKPTTMTSPESTTTTPPLTKHAIKAPTQEGGGGNIRKSEHTMIQAYTPHVLWQEMYKAASAPPKHYVKGGHIRRLGVMPYT
jgi:hypothetical protein